MLSILPKPPSRRIPQSGFTIVELLIVIVVIAILAAIVIVSYNGISRRAIETSMKSDLRSASNILESDLTSGGTYPATSSAANNGQGLKAGNNTALSYVLKPYGYCVSATNPKTTASYAIKSSKGSIDDGDCQTQVSTFAGSGAASSVDGTGTAASFNEPNAVKIDTSGNFYIAEGVGNRIRKITPTGAVTTFAGSGTAGSANGPAASAQFNNPYKLGIDSTGAIYVADVSNNRIRKIAGGVVTTFAGSTQGYADGTGTAAKFDHPYGLAVDVNSGTVYIGDAWNVRIRKATPAGVVTTSAGGIQGYQDGTGAAAKFRDIDGMGVDGSGNVYIADYTDHRIRKMTPSGVVTTVAGNGSAGMVDGTGTAAQFNYPTDIAVDASGFIYVVDQGNSAVRQISPAGVVTTIAGGGTAGYSDGAGGTAQFNGIAGIAVDSTGTLYIADSGNNRIRKIVQ